MVQTKKRRSSKRMIKKRRQRRLVILGFICVLFILVLIIIGLVMRGYVSKFPTDVAAHNVYVGPVNVSGMTKKEIQTALEEHLAQEKTTKVTFAVEDAREEAVLEELGLGYKDIKALSKEAVSYGKKGSLWSRYWELKGLNKEKVVLEENYIVDEELTTQLAEDRLVPLANLAQDATIEKTSEGFQITEEKEGTTINLEKTMDAIEVYLNESWDYEDFSLDVVLQRHKPSVKAADLETIQDELGSFSTDAGGGTRLQNLQTGVSKLNGLIVMPGEEVSVHDVTAPYDAENGYVEAGSYENGQVVETFGGGICQVSSTLYNALLYAEIEIVERFPHSMIVTYVEPSRDAAIAGDTKDLVFKNNYDTPIYIKGEIDTANQLTITVYGKETREEGRRVEYETEIISTTEYEKVYKADPEASLGSMQNGGSPHTGKEARLWKIVYQDDEEVSREDINYSNYSKSDYIIKVGTKSDSVAASSLVQQAIATQDINKIYAAINQASTMQ